MIVTIKLARAPPNRLESARRTCECRVVTCVAELDLHLANSVLAYVSAQVPTHGLLHGFPPQLPKYREQAANNALQRECPEPEHMPPLPKHLQLQLQLLLSFRKIKPGTRNTLDLYTIMIIH